MEAPEYEEIALARVFGARGTTALRTPMVQETQLPLPQLAPEVFERLVVEFAWLVEGLRTVHIYGRRGQPQYGLDVVGTDRFGMTVVYQAKRFQTITIKEIREAVGVYAGWPTGEPPTLPARQFDAGRFALVTSASIEGDIALTDDIRTLQVEYLQYGLTIDVFGVEHISRALRDAGGLVHAVFGPEWARAFCGVERPPPPPGSPSAYGLLEGPLEECGVADAADRGRQLAATEPELSAELLSSVADELRTKGYRGHADVIGKEAARVLLASGRAAAAFDIEWRITTEPFLCGTTIPGPMKDWHRRLADDPVRQARVTILESLRDWFGCAFDLSSAVSALDTLRDVADPDHPGLACMALEQALVDGLYTTVPPVSWIGSTLPDEATDLLDRLLSHARHAADLPGDRTWRCRLRCAAADAELDRQGYNLADVTTAYAPIIADAGAGRMPPVAAALAHARCARAYAAAGEVDAAIDQWRRTFRESLLSDYGGDAQSAMACLTGTVYLEGGIVLPEQINQIIAGIPNRRRFLDGRHGAYFTALEDLQAGKPRLAIRNIRRSILQEHVAGYFSEERTSRRLFCDILTSTNRHWHAAIQAVLAGDGKKAAACAEAADEWIDFRDIARSCPRWATAAAIRAISAQHDLVPDDQVADVVDLLLPVVQAVWSTPAAVETPPGAAFNALTRFAFRISEEQAAALLDIAEPGLTAANSKCP